MTTNLFLERTFDPPRSVADVHAGVRESEWCFQLYNLEWRSSFLAADGRAMICWFAAPDKESARIALRQSGTDTTLLWAGTVHEAREPVVPNIVVTRSFGDPLSLEDIQSIEDTAAPCLQARRVKYSRSFVSIDRKRVLGLYQAPDAESVSLARREAAMPVDSAWAFVRIGPDTMAPGR
jgi:hypothetical protein